MAPAQGEGAGFVNGVHKLVSGQNAAQVAIAAGRNNPHMMPTQPGLHLTDKSFLVLFSKKNVLSFV
jgi:hypothetical protein